MWLEGFSSWTRTWTLAASVLWMWWAFSWWHPVIGFTVFIYGLATFARVFPWNYFSEREYHATHKAQYDAMSLFDVDEVFAAMRVPLRAQYGDDSDHMGKIELFIGWLRYLMEDGRVIEPYPDFPAFECFQEKSFFERRALIDRACAQAAPDKERALYLVQQFTETTNRLTSSIQTIPGPFLIPACELLPDVSDAIGNTVNWLWSEDARRLNIGGTFRNTFNENRRVASAQVLSKTAIEQGERLYPAEYAHETKATPSIVAAAYLRGTPLSNIFLMPVPWGFSEALRPEHGVIVAGSGGGKTQFLESLILDDLELDDPPGIILIDSKGEMIERIAHLDVFHPDHGRLRDRLIIIDHKDKPALNMFDVDEELVNTKINEVASLMRYFFGGLFGSQLSDQMDVLFLPLLHLVLRIKGATLHTFAELVGNPRKYPDVLAKIPQGPRNFILNHYDDRGYAQTKTGIVTRLHRIINEVTLDEMFSARNNAVDIGRALNEGKIILVSTDADGLQDLSPIFGKYFIAQVMNAGLSRGSRQRVKGRPIHFYIDECAPYVDDKLAQMLTTIRSYGVGVMMAFQGEWQMKTYTQAILGNTAIKVVGQASEADARAFASDMHTSPEFIQEHRKRGSVGRFACYTSDLPHAISVELPFGKLDEWDQMPDRDYHRMRVVNRDRVAKGQPDELRDATLAQHFSTSGPLWGRLEDAAKRFGAVNEVGDFEIDRIADKISAEQRRTFHTLRIQRNQLTHRSTPIPDLQWWQTEAHALIAIFTTPNPDDPTAATPDF